MTQSQRLKPAPNKIILQKIEDKPVTRNGLILPDEKKKHLICKVISIGFDISCDDYDIVIIKEFSGIRLSFQDQDYIIIEEQDILAEVLD